MCFSYCSRREHHLTQSEPLDASGPGAVCHDGDHRGRGEGCHGRGAAGCDRRGQQSRAHRESSFGRHGRAGTVPIIELRPGTYTVTFSLPGFSGVRREGIELTTGSRPCWMP